MFFRLFNYVAKINHIFIYLYTETGLVHEKRQIYTYEGKGEGRGIDKDRFLNVPYVLCAAGGEITAEWQRRMATSFAVLWSSSNLPYPLTSGISPLFALASLMPFFLPVSSIQPVNKLKTLSILQKFLDSHSSFCKTLSYWLLGYHIPLVYFNLSDLFSFWVPLLYCSQIYYLSPHPLQQSGSLNTGISILAVVLTMVLVEYYVLNIIKYSCPQKYMFRSPTTAPASYSTLQNKVIDFYLTKYICHSK